MRFLQEFTSYMVFRTFFIFASTAFSILIVMLLLNIITIDEVVKILNLSPEAADALRTVFSRIQEVTKNLLDIISQLLTKLFSFADIKVDLNKIAVDVHQGDHGAASAAGHVVDSGSAASSAGAPDPVRNSDSGLITVPKQ